MADATSVQVCIDRHRQYPHDIAGRLKSIQRERLRLMAAHVRPKESVLDVGCNSGYIVDFVPPSCVCHGVDVAEELVTIAKRRLRTAQVAPAETLPFLDDTFDVVMLGEILEHVHDPEAVIYEAARVARRLVVGSTPHEQSQWGPGQKKGPETHRFHVRCFTETTLAETLGPLSQVQVGIAAWQDVPQFYVFAGRVR